MFSVQGLGFSVQCEVVEIVANGRVRSQAMRQIKLLELLNDEYNQLSK